MFFRPTILVVPHTRPCQYRLIPKRRRQVKHLFRVAPGRDKGLPRFIVIKALFYAVVAIPGYGRRMDRAHRLLEQEIRGL